MMTHVALPEPALREPGEPQGDGHDPLHGDAQEHGHEREAGSSKGHSCTLWTFIDDNQIIGKSPKPREKTTVEGR